MSQRQLVASETSPFDGAIRIHGDDPRGSPLFDAPWSQAALAMRDSRERFQNLVAGSAVHGPDSALAAHRLRMRLREARVPTKCRQDPHTEQRSIAEPLRKPECSFTRARN